MIKKISKAAVLAVAVSGLHVASLATPAHAQVGVAEGRRCGFTSVTDPTIENGEVQTGQINGGPLVATAPGATITLTCTIQVGAGNSTHNGTDSATATSAASLQTATVPPTLVSYGSPDGQPVYMCSTATINGVTYYWDATTGTWSTSSAVTCNEAISQEIFPGPLAPVLDLLDSILIPIEQQIDLIICPVITTLSPGVPGVVDITTDGDVTVLGIPFWDCPPYEV